MIYFQFPKVFLNISTFFRQPKLFFIMSEARSIEKIKKNAQEAKDTITSLKNELNFINKEYNNILVRQLKEENAKLLIAVEEAKKKLIQIEVRNGVKQIPLPHNMQLSTAVNPPIIPTQQPKEQSSAEQKPKNEKKPKVPKQAPTELPIDIGRLDLRIGKIVDVRRHPDADSLYVLTIECGEDKPRTVCSGLVKHVPLDQLQDQVVMVLCNLKPVKMRGIISEAMVMCASSEQGVEVLIPPPDSQSGELVHCDGYTRQPDAVMNPKKKIFETVAPDLHTNANLEACYKGVPFSLPGKGTFHSKTLKNVSVK